MSARPDAAVFPLVLSGDGARLAGWSAGDEKRIGIWDVHSGLHIADVPGEVEGYGRQVPVLLSYSGHVCLARSALGQLMVWSPEWDGKLATFTADSSVHCMAFASEVGVVVSGDEQGCVHFLKLEGIPFDENNLNR